MGISKEGFFRNGIVCNDYELRLDSQWTKS